MRAVSSKVWNGWKATLLRELYSRVAEVLEGGLATAERDVRVARAKQAVGELLTDRTAGGIRAFRFAGLRRLLAVVRSGNACPACQADPGGGAAQERR